MTPAMFNQYVTTTLTQTIPNEITQAVVNGANGVTGAQGFDRLMNAITHSAAAARAQMPFPFYISERVGLWIAELACKVLHRLQFRRLGTVGADGLLPCPAACVSRADFPVQCDAVFWRTLGWQDGRTDPCADYRTNGCRGCHQTGRSVVPADGAERHRLGKCQRGLFDECRRPEFRRVRPWCAQPGGARDKTPRSTPTMRSRRCWGCWCRSSSASCCSLPRLGLPTASAVVVGGIPDRWSTA